MSAATAGRIVTSISSGKGLRQALDLQQLTLQLGCGKRSLARRPPVLEMREERTGHRGAGGESDHDARRLHQTPACRKADDAVLAEPVLVGHVQYLATASLFAGGGGDSRLIKRAESLEVF